MQVEVRPIFGIVENFARFRENRRRQLGGAVDRSVFSEKVSFGPVLPRLERLAFDFGREANAKPLIEVDAGDHDARPAWEVGPILPKRPVGGLVELADLQRFDRPSAPDDADSAKCRPIFSYEPPGAFLVIIGVEMPEEKERAGWRVAGSEIVIDTPHLRLRRDEIVLPDGSRLENYYVRESLGFSVIFALTPGEHVVLVRQYKHGIGRTVLELPAGAIDPGETPLECAERELAEETGYATTGGLEQIATFATDPTNSDATFHLFLGRDAWPASRQKPDVTETIDVRLAGFDELRRFVRDGTIEVGSHVAAIYFVLDRLGKL